jgi:hypothetical protein
MAASRKATHAMKEYQLFILTLEGRVKAQYDLICADDDDAKKRAAKFYTVFSVELWDGPRCVVRFPSKLSDSWRLTG